MGVTGKSFEMNISEDWAKKHKYRFTLIRVLVPLFTFYVCSLLIYILTDEKVADLLDDRYLILFSVSVFLGSAAYDLCSKIIKMSPTLFIELVNKAMKGGIIVFILAILMLVVGLLTTVYSKESALFALGAVIYIAMLLYIYKLVKDFDSGVSELIASLKSEEENKLLKSLEAHFDKRYAKSGSCNKEKS